MKPRILTCGDMVWPRRGRPPPPLPEYVVEPGDPYIHRLVYKPCKYRENRGKPAPCCKDVMVNHYWCSLKDDLIVNGICNGCTSIVAPTPEEIQLIEELRLAKLTRKFTDKVITYEDGSVAVL